MDNFHIPTSGPMKKKMPKNVVSSEELAQKIVDVLEHSSCHCLCVLANQCLGATYTYLGDSLFAEVETEKP